MTDVVDIANLPEEMVLNIISYLPLRDLLNLEQTNSSFKALSESEKAQPFWRQRLESRFPNALQFKTQSRSFRDYYIALARVFEKMNRDPRNPAPFFLASLLPSYLFDIPGLEPHNKNISPGDYTRYGPADFHLSLLHLNNDYDVVKYLVNWVISYIPKFSESYWIYFLVADNTTELSRWFYNSFRIPPVKVFSTISLDLLDKIPRRSLEYIISIYPRESLKFELDKLIRSVETEKNDRIQKQRDYFMRNSPAVRGIGQPSIGIDPNSLPQKPLPSSDNLDYLKSVYNSL